MTRVRLPRGTDRVEPLDTDQASARQSPRDLFVLVWDQTAPELARVVAALGIAPSAVDDVLQDTCLAACAPLLRMPMRRSCAAGCFGSQSTVATWSTAALAVGLALCES